jgi:hypothetical protein
MTMLARSLSVIREYQTDQPSLFAPTAKPAGLTIA